MSIRSFFSRVENDALHAGHSLVGTALTTFESALGELDTAVETFEHVVASADAQIENLVERRNNAVDAQAHAERVQDKIKSLLQ